MNFSSGASDHLCCVMNQSVTSAGINLRPRLMPEQKMSTHLTGMQHGSMAAEFGEHGETIAAALGDFLHIVIVATCEGGWRGN